MPLDNLITSFTFYTTLSILTFFQESTFIKRKWPYAWNLHVISSVCLMLSWKFFGIKECHEWERSISKSESVFNVSRRCRVQLNFWFLLHTWISLQLEFIQFKRTFHWMSIVAASVSLRLQHHAAGQIKVAQTHPLRLLIISTGVNFWINTSMTEELVTQMQTTPANLHATQIFRKLNWRAEALVSLNHHLDQHLCNQTDPQFIQWTHQFRLLSIGQALWLQWKIKGTVTRAGLLFQLPFVNGGTRTSHHPQSSYLWVDCFVLYNWFNWYWYLKKNRNKFLSIAIYRMMAVNLDGRQKLYLISTRMEQLIHPTFILAKNRQHAI